MFTLALILTLALPQDPAADRPPPDPAVIEQAARDAMAAADAYEREEWAAACLDAREAKARIIAAAVRLGEGDPDLVRAWGAADRIERRVCSVPAQADGVNAPDL